MSDQISPVPDIKMHPEYGMNPHPSICPLCGQRDGTIVMLGAVNNRFRCDRCKTVHVGDKRPISGCPRCRATSKHVKFFGKLRPEDAVVGNICTECQKKIDLADKIVAEGGIYWRCSDCRSRGAIKANHPLAKKARQDQGIPAPEPCGVEFNLNNCPVCGEAARKQAEAARTAEKLERAFAREGAVEMEPPQAAPEVEE